MRANLSREQYSELGKLPNIVKVIRKGIDNAPREMELDEVAWSRISDEIKEEIWLYDKEDVREVPSMGWIGRGMRRVAEHDLIIKDLLDILVSEGIIKEKKIKEMKAKITKERQWEKRREFRQLDGDLDDYRSLEEE